MLTVSSSVIYQFQLARYILFALNSNQSDSKNDNNCSNVHVVLVDLIFTPAGLFCGAWALRAGNNNCSYTPCAKNEASIREATTFVCSRLQNA